MDLFDEFVILLTFILFSSNELHLKEKT